MSLINIIVLSSLIYCIGNNITTSKTWENQQLLTCVLNKNMSSAGRRPLTLPVKGHHNLTLLLLLLGGDIEQNPGPRAPKHPCQISKRAVTWKQRGVACDDCSQWYHAECMHITSPVYKALNNPNISWHCVNCGMPNFSTSLFESFMVNMSNTYDHLSDSNLPDSPGQPFFTSSPLKPLRGENGRSNYNKPKNTKILVINFQSVKNKKEELCNLIDSSNPSTLYDNWHLNMAAKRH